MDILLVLLIILLLCGGGYGLGNGWHTGGISLIGVIVIVLIVLLLRGRI